MDQDKNIFLKNGLNGTEDKPRPKNEQVEDGPYWMECVYETTFTPPDLNSICHKLYCLI